MLPSTVSGSTDQHGTRPGRTAGAAGGRSTEATQRSRLRHVKPTDCKLRESSGKHLEEKRGDRCGPSSIEIGKHTLFRNRRL